MLDSQVTYPQDNSKQLQSFNLRVKHCGAGTTPVTYITIKFVGVAHHSYINFKLILEQVEQVFKSMAVQSSVHDHRTKHSFSILCKIKHRVADIFRGRNIFAKASTRVLYEFFANTVNVATSTMLHGGNFILIPAA